MKKLVAGGLLTLVLLGCATAPETQTQDQRERQSLALQIAGAKLSRIKNGSSKTDVQEMMGASSNRQIFIEGSVATELWWYAYDTGFARLKFADGKLVEQKTYRSHATWVRDTTMPLTDEEVRIHLTFSVVGIGWTRAQVSLLPMKPSVRLTEKEATDVMANTREMLTKFKDGPVLMGADLSDVLDIRGDWWIYAGPRLGCTLVFQDDKVVEISFSEAPTKAQLNDALRRMI